MMLRPKRPNAGSLMPGRLGSSATPATIGRVARSTPAARSARRPGRRAGPGRTSERTRPGWRRVRRWRRRPPRHRGIPTRPGGGGLGAPSGSIGSTIANAMYRIKPSPPLRLSRMNAARTHHPGMPMWSAIPPATPPMRRRERRYSTGRAGSRTVGDEAGADVGALTPPSSSLRRSIGIGIGPEFGQSVVQGLIRGVPDARDVLSGDR